MRIGRWNETERSVFFVNASNKSDWYVSNGTLSLTLLLWQLFLYTTIGEAIYPKNDSPQHFFKNNYLCLLNTLKWLSALKLIERWALGRLDFPLYIGPYSGFGQ